MDYRELFRILVKQKGSDLIIKANGCPAMRVQGQIKFVSETKRPAALRGVSWPTRSSPSV